MIAPPTFDIVRAPMVRALGWRVLVALALLAMPSAFAGDTPDLDTFIHTGPPPVTTSTTADLSFSSTAANALFMCALDDEDYAPCDEGTWHRDNITPGEHRFWVYSMTRSSGRVDDTPASWEWVVEEAPPLDAGSPEGDGGVPEGDAGSPAGDGGASDADAGPGGNDGGTAGSDAGPGEVDGGGSGSDAGPGGDGGASGGDAGPGGNDGGATQADAGPGGNDGGTSGGEDGGVSGEDGGTAPGDDAGQPGQVPPGDTPLTDELDYLGSGMGCTGAPAPATLAGLMLLMLALHRRRRR